MLLLVMVVYGILSMVILVLLLLQAVLARVGEGRGGGGLGGVAAVFVRAYVLGGEREGRWGTAEHGRRGHEGFARGPGWNRLGGDGDDGSRRCWLRFFQPEGMARWRDDLGARRIKV
ncbi:hypothetical protein GGR56DRAFT_649168 [Xylariaceae sp. FL0804]|nr:hypothetical protein GGR56DRAFT_649168 [Xylariaceae sp. FL0804]